jgi:hypothetical protein
MSRDLSERPPEGRTCQPDEVAEVSLLLPRRLVAELEGLAAARGLTLGRLIRQLLREHLAGAAGRRKP